jgi:hypothetical protein
VFFFTLLGIFAVPTRWSLSRYAAVTAFIALLLLFAVTWTGIKGEYRYYVSQGSADQAVNAAYGDRIAKLVDLTMQMDRQKMGDAAADLVNRVSYVDLFAFIVTQVPDVIPHENGALWWDAIVRPFTPRLLFPDKSGIDDSQRSNLFGLAVAGSEDATSIGMGYLAETYIDFGGVTMMLVICAFGLALGYIYHRFLFRPPFRGFVGMALSTNLLYAMVLLETSITKLIGALVVVLLVSWLMARFVVPVLAPWLSDASDRNFAVPQS